jgi:hypothetical protein
MPDPASAPDHRARALLGGRAAYRSWFRAGAVLVLAAACGSASERPQDVEPGPPDAAAGAAAAGPTPDQVEGGTDAGAAPPDAVGPLGVVAVTFNTGTPDLPHAKAFGHGLASTAAIAEASAFLAGVAPDVVGFQEVFPSSQCPDIPPDARAGTVCEGWSPSDPSVPERLLGAGYQVACHDGKPDKCAAVKLSFGRFEGCAGALCLDGLEGAPIAGCGGGARVARGIVELANGGVLTVVHVHGTSGMSAKDMRCRKLQFRHIFKDLLRDPVPGVRATLVLGDFNTDPGRFDAFDEGAAELAKHVDGKAFHFLTDVGPNALPTYRVSLLSGSVPLGVNIDHVVSDRLKGSCWAAGVTPGHPPVGKAGVFDHVPIVCTLSE